MDQTTIERYDAIIKKLFKLKDRIKNLNEEKKDIEENIKNAIM